MQMVEVANGACNKIKLTKTILTGIYTMYVKQQHVPSAFLNHVEILGIKCEFFTVFTFSCLQQAINHMYILHFIIQAWREKMFTEVNIWAPVYY